MLHAHLCPIRLKWSYAFTVCCTRLSQPRVLSGPQIASLKDKIAGWSERVKTSLFFVEDKTRELFA